MLATCGMSVERSGVRSTLGGNAASSPMSDDRTIVRTSLFNVADG